MSICKCNCETHFGPRAGARPGYPPPEPAGQITARAVACWAPPADGGARAGRKKVSVEYPRFRQVLGQFAPYKPGKAPSVTGGRSFKLSSNESPFGPLPSVLKVIAEAASGINRYPDNGAAELTGAIAARFKVPASDVAVGCGSVGVVQQLLEAVAEPGAEVLYAWRSFEAYPYLSDLAGATSLRVPLRDETHDLPAMADAITERTRLIFLCNPNHPTGTVVRRAG